MTFVHTLEYISLQILLIPTIIIVCVGVIVSVKLNFIQFKAFPQMFVALFNALKPQKNNEGKETIRASRALFTAMSTTIGTSSIVAPAIAIRLGGPGALVGFLIATLLGGALTYAEVALALRYRKKNKDGTIAGGPMQYLKSIHPSLAKLYAVSGVVLLAIWSSLQANTLADLLYAYDIPNYVTGIVLSLLVLGALLGGIQRIGKISEKLVPFMFFLYTGAALWIIGLNISQLPGIVSLIYTSAFTPSAFFGGVATGSAFSAIRWGLFRGVQANEAGVGTAAIPHSMAEIYSPQEQGILAMVSIYSHGFICLLSGLVTLCTGTWSDYSLPFGISLITRAFELYFSSFGPFVLTLSAILFAYGTIVGNSYNGSQCFSYFSGKSNVRWYYFLVAFLILGGAISRVKLLWIISDFFLIPVALPNIIGILILIFKEESFFARYPSTAQLIHDKATN